MKINVNWEGIVLLIICSVVLLKANDVIFKYIAFVGIIYLVKR